MIPFDECPFWAHMSKNHPERGEDGFRAYKAMYADIAGSYDNGPGSNIYQYVEKRIGYGHMTDAHYYRLIKFNHRAVEAIQAENWKALNTAVIAAHCEGAKILEEMGVE